MAAFGGRSLADLSPEAVASWCTTLLGVLPKGVPAALGDRIMQEGFDGHSFSVLIHQNKLSCLGVKGLELNDMHKVRKCWHQDFPASTSVRDQAFTPPQSARSHEPTSSATARRPIGSFGSGSTYAVGAADEGPPRSARQWGPAEGHVVEHLRAALDLVAERGGHERQEVYLWVHEVLPNEVWQPLWDAVTADMLREQQHHQPFQAASADIEPTAWQQSPPRTARGTQYSQPRQPSAPLPGAAHWRTAIVGSCGNRGAPGQASDTIRGSLLGPCG